MAPQRYEEVWKNPNLFGFSFGLHYFDLRSKVLSFENKKKNKFSFCILLTYSYLCSVNGKWNEERTEVYDCYRGYDVDSHDVIFV